MGKALPELVFKLWRCSSATQFQAGAKTSASALGVGQKMLSPYAPGAARTPSCFPGLCRGPRRAWAHFGAEAHSHPPVGVPAPVCCSGALQALLPAWGPQAGPAESLGRGTRSASPSLPSPSQAGSHPAMAPLF